MSSSRYLRKRASLAYSERVQFEASTPLKMKKQYNFRLGRRSSRRDNNPPPPARRGQGVPDSLQTLTNSSDFANSKKSSGNTGVPPTLPSESFFHASASFFQLFLIFGAVQKIIKNQTSITSSQNLKNRTPGCPKLDCGAILDPPHPLGAGRVK